MGKKENTQEQYYKTLYNYLANKDSKFRDAIPDAEKFRTSMGDSTYANSMYKYLSKGDKTFQDKLSFDKFYDEFKPKKKNTKSYEQFKSSTVGQSDIPQDYEQPTIGDNSNDKEAQKKDVLPQIEIKSTGGTGEKIPQEDWQEEMTEQVRDDAERQAEVNLPKDVNSDTFQEDWQEEMTNRNNTMQQRLSRFELSADEKVGVDLANEIDQIVPVKNKDESFSAYLGGSVDRLYQGFAKTFRGVQEIVDVVDGTLKQITGKTLMQKKLIQRSIIKEYEEKGEDLTLDKLSELTRERKSRVDEESKIFNKLGDWYDESATAFKKMPETMGGNILGGVVDVIPLVAELALTPEIKIAQVPGILGASKGYITAIPKLTTLEGIKGYFRGINEDKEANFFESTLSGYREMGIGAKDGLFMHSVGVGSNMFSKYLTGAAESAYGKAITTTGKIITKGLKSSSAGITYSSLSNGLGFGGIAGYDSWVRTGKIDWEATAEGVGVGVGLNVPAFARLAKTNITDKAVTSAKRKAVINIYTSTSDAIMRVNDLNIHPTEMRKASEQLGEKIILEKDNTKRGKLIAEKNIIDNIIDIDAMSQDIATNPEAHKKYFRYNKDFTAKEEMAMNERIDFIAENVKVREEVRTKDKAKEELEKEQESKYEIDNKEVSKEELINKVTEAKDKGKDINYTIKNDEQTTNLLVDATKESKQGITENKEANASLIGKEKKTVKTDVKKPKPEGINEREGKIINDIKNIKEGDSPKKVWKEYKDLGKDISVEGEKEFKDEYIKKQKAFQSRQNELIKEKEKDINVDVNGDMIIDEIVKPVKIKEKVLEVESKTDKDLEKDLKENYTISSDEIFEKFKSKSDKLKDNIKGQKRLIRDFLKINKKKLKGIGLGEEDIRKMNAMKAGDYASTGEVIKHLTSKIDKANLSLFLKENTKQINKLTGHGQVISAMMNKVSQAQTIKEVERAKEYITKVLKDNDFRKEQKNKFKAIDDLKKNLTGIETSKGKRAKTQAKRGFRGRTAESKDIAERVERIRQRIEKEEKAPNKDKIVDDLENIDIKIEKLKESIDKSGTERDKEIERLENEREEIEISGLQHLDGEMFDHVLGKAKDIIKSGKTKVRRERDARHKRHIRESDLLIEWLGGIKDPGSSDVQNKRNRARWNIVKEADFSSVLNMLSSNSNKAALSLDRALLHDNVKDIRRYAMDDKGKKLYDSIDKDFDVLRDMLKPMGCENKELTTDMLKDIEKINKKGYYQFKDYWYSELTDKGRRIFDETEKTILNKYRQLHKDYKKQWDEYGLGRNYIQRKILTESVYPAEDAKAKASYDFYANMFEVQKKIFGKKGLDRKFDKYRFVDEECPVMRVDHNMKLVNEKMSMMQGLQKWLELKMDDSHDKFFTSSKKIGDNTYTGGMGWNEKSVKQLNDWLPQELKDYGLWLQKTYKEIGESIQSTYIKDKGVPLDQIENYVPTVVITQRTGGLDRSLLDSKEFRRGLTSKRFIKKTPNSNPLAFIDAQETMTAYFDEMIRYKYMSEPVRELESLFHSKVIRDAVKQNYGDKYIKTIDGFVDALRGDVMKSSTDKTIDQMITSITKGTLLGSTSVGLMQTISTSMYLTDMPVNSFTTGTALMLSNNKLSKSIRGLLDIQGYFADRGSAALSIEIADVGNNARHGIPVTWYGRTTKKIRKFVGTYTPSTQFKKTHDKVLGSVIAYGDKFPAIVGGGAYLMYKYKYISGEKLTPKIIKDYTEGEKNESLDRALKEWSITSELTQQSTRASMLSEFRRQGGWSRSLTMFTSAAGQLHRRTSEFARNFYRGDEKTKNLKAMLVSHVLVGGLIRFAKNGFQWDDKKQTMGIVLGNFNGVAGLGKIADVIEGYVTDSPFIEETITGNPVGASIWKLTNAIIRLRDESQKRVPNKERVTRSYMDIAGEMARLEGVNLNLGLRVYRSTKDVIGEREKWSDIKLRDVTDISQITSKYDTGVELVDIFKPRPDVEIMPYDSDITKIVKESYLKKYNHSQIIEYIKKFGKREGWDNNRIEKIYKTALRKLDTRNIVGYGDDDVNEIMSSIDNQGKAEVIMAMYEQMDRKEFNKKIRDYQRANVVTSDVYNKYMRLKSLYLQSKGKK